MSTSPAMRLDNPIGLDGERPSWDSAGCVWHYAHRREISAGAAKMLRPPTVPTGLMQGPEPRTLRPGVPGAPRSRLPSDQISR